MKRHRTQHGHMTKVPARAPTGDATETAKEEWSIGASTQVTMSRYPYLKDVNDRVQLVHVEEFSKTPNGAQLSMRDIWVDVVTAGARLQRSATMPLRDLGAASTGVHLYAGKTEDSVVFLATRDDDTESVFSIGSDGSEESSNCGHMLMPVALMKGLSVESQFVTRIARNVPEDPKDPDGASNRTSRSGHVTMSAQWEADEAKPFLAFSSGWDTREKSND